MSGNHLRGVAEKSSFSGRFLVSKEWVGGWADTTLITCKQAQVFRAVFVAVLSASCTASTCPSPCFEAGKSMMNVEQARLNWD